VPIQLALVLKRRGIRPGELAKATGYSAASVSRIMHGKQPATALFRALVVEELGQPEHELFPEVAAKAEAAG
jgi:transcriptional regulator with XRE-family HTH domain